MIQYISKPFKYFFKLESASGLVLLFAAVIALFISNSSLSENYFKILETYFTLGTNEFGLKLSVWYDEFKRNRKRLETVVEDLRYGLISGAVGNYANISPELEQLVCKELSLKPVELELGLDKGLLDL